VVKLETLKWWKWAFWFMVAGQGLLLYGLWKFLSRANSGGITRTELLPSLATGLGLYLLGRGIQIAARSRERRLAKEAASKESA
jgi:hypothetical protein